MGERIKATTPNVELTEWKGTLEASMEEGVMPCWAEEEQRLSEGSKEGDNQGSYVFFPISLRPLIPPG